MTSSTFRLTGILVKQRGENLQWVFITASDSKIQCWVVKTNLQASMISMSLNHPKMILAEKDRPARPTAEPRARKKQKLDHCPK